MQLVGLPNQQFFPFDTLEAQSAQSNRWKPTPNHPEPEWEDAAADELEDAGTVGPSSYSSSSADSTTADKPAQHLTIPAVSGERNPSRRVDVATALQYGTAQGYPSLLSWVRQFTREHLHPNVPYAGGPEVILTCGSTDGMAKSIEMLVDSWLPEYQPLTAREGLLLEKFAYPNALNQALPKGMQAVPVEIDEMGMLAHGPGSLDDVLANWDYAQGKRPRIMYTVTMGHNPTSGVLSVRRRREIYSLCEKYDVIIIEDDPYWYLQYPSAAAEEAKSRNHPAPDEITCMGTSSSSSNQERSTSEKSSGFAFLDSLVPSYLSMDVSGRVIRLDTFSKTIAPGCRLGWITAQPAFVDRLLRITETSTQQPSGFVQSMVATLVLGPQPPAPLRYPIVPGTSNDSDDEGFQGWDVSGWVRWLEGLRGSYERRMVRMSTILDAGSILVRQSTPSSLVDRDYGVISTTRLLSFRWPRGGMFAWIRIYFEDHPLFNAPRPLQQHASSLSLSFSSPSTTYVKRRRVVDGSALNQAFTIFCTRKPHLVLVSPGTMFSATDSIRAAEGWKYYRICFAAETDDNVDACTRRFISALHKFWKIRKVDEIEELLHDFSSTGSGADTVATMGMGNLGWIGC